jgi:flap endonuclease-1
LVDHVLTEDMDILTFGSKNIVRNLASYKKEPIEIKLENILNKLNFTYDNFIEFCMLLGCDYLNGLYDINANIIYKHYSLYKDINKTILSLKRNGYLVNQLEYKDVKKYFLSSDNFIKVSKDNLNLTKPDKNLLLNLLVNKYGLVKYKIDNKINFLIDFYDKNQKDIVI